MSVKVVSAKVSFIIQLLYNLFSQGTIENTTAHLETKIHDATGNQFGYENVPLVEFSQSQGHHRKDLLEYQIQSPPHEELLAAWLSGLMHLPPDSEHKICALE